MEKGRRGVAVAGGAVLVGDNKSPSFACNIPPLSTSIFSHISPLNLSQHLHLYINLYIYQPDYFSFDSIFVPYLLHHSPTTFSLFSIGVYLYIYTHTTPTTSHTHTHIFRFFFFFLCSSFVLHKSYTSKRFVRFCVYRGVRSFASVRLNIV
ncbi:hypothetical protein L1887_31875 [Cichorium endivia]|nr:hypothetical protein L1887_31875 [Cichorium endivia]